MGSWRATLEPIDLLADLRLAEPPAANGGLELGKPSTTHYAVFSFVTPAGAPPRVSLIRRDWPQPPTARTWRRSGTRSSATVFTPARRQHRASACCCTPNWLSACTGTGDAGERDIRVPF